MTRLSTLAYLLSALAATILADPMPAPTPSPERFPHDSVAADIAARQLNPGVNPNAATLAPGQVPAVTVYGIASQIGATAAQIEVTYTQLFSPVPDQWPAAQSGAIGYGTLHKRDVVEARATGIAGRIRVS